MCNKDLKLPGPKMFPAPCRAAISMLPLLFHLLPLLALFSSANHHHDGGTTTNNSSAAVTFRARRSISTNPLQTPLCMSGREKPKDGKPIARVAIALYGLFRHDCGSINFEGVFKEALKKSTKFTYVVDVMVHANIAVNEDGHRNFGLDHVVDQRIRMPALEFLRFNPCKFDATDQNVVDSKIEQTLKQTCYKYGDFWDDNKECSTTKNYFRALFSQNDVANLIVSHQKKSGIKYDVVALVRPDVMFTLPMDVGLFDRVVESGRNGGEEMLYNPEWGSGGGYNDRFLVGHPNPVLHIMQRFNRIVDFVESPLNTNKLGKHFGKKIHSESYMKWTIINYFTKLHQSGKQGALFNGKRYMVRFRRVRSDGALVGAQYKRGRLRDIDTWKFCNKEKLLKMFPTSSED